MTTKLPWSALQYFQSIDTLTYKGLHDASGGAYPGGGTVGDYYKVSVPGVISGTTYVLGEYFGYDGSNYAKIPIDYLGFDVTQDGLVIVTDYDETTDTPRAEVKLLVHANGSDGSTTITDRSVTPHTLTAVNAVLDDAQAWRGLTSILFDGATAYVTIPDHADFYVAGDDFTIEARVMFAGVGTRQMLMGQQSSDTSDKGWKLFFDPTDGLCFSFATAAGDWTDEFNVAWVPVISTWYHVVVTRNGTEMLLFVDGELLYTYDCGADALVNCGEDLWIGASPESGGSEFLNGWLDEIRFTNDLCWWATDFYPDVVPYNTIIGYRETTIVMPEYVAPPITPTTGGNPGDWSYSAGYRYECVAANTWVRHVVATTW